MRDDTIKKRLSLAELNRLTPEQFVAVVGSVFEKSPWIAAATAGRRPFSTLEHALAEWRSTVLAASAGQKLELICAHPDLVGLAALTAESTREQSAAGLGNLSAEEIQLFQTNNAAYREKFGFPFVICARLNKKDAILSGFRQRLPHTREHEIETALEEIFKIAELRLRDIVEAAKPAKLSTHVLDTTRGCPACGMRIELWSIDGANRLLLKGLETNTDGRTDAPLLEGGDVRDGQYELIFFVGDYFKNPVEDRFLDRVPVRFQLKAGGAYHVPLLCSPWSYSTYRGS